jgi:hypothetical protein
VISAALRRSRRFVVRVVASVATSIWSSKTALSFRPRFARRRNEPTLGGF